MTLTAATLIIWCMGGSVADFSDRATSGEAFAIVGRADSSCTLFLAADDVCVSPNATLHFHRPQLGYIVKRPLEGDDLIAWGKYIAAHYPPALADRYMREVIYGGGTIDLRGQELIEQYGLSNCKTE